MVFCLCPIPPGADEKLHHASEKHSRISLKSLSFLGRLPPSLFVVVCCFLLFFILGFQSTASICSWSAGEAISASQVFMRLEKLLYGNRICRRCSDLNFDSVYLSNLSIPLFVFLSSSETQSIHPQYLLILKEASISSFVEQRPCFLSLPTARAAMQSDPSPSCQCKVDPTLSC